jgi:hypothetical protein
MVTKKAFTLQRLGARAGKNHVISLTISSEWLLGASSRWVDPPRLIRPDARFPHYPSHPDNSFRCEALRADDRFRNFSGKRLRIRADCVHQTPG